MNAPATAQALNATRLNRWSLAGDDGARLNRPPTRMKGPSANLQIVAPAPTVPLPLPKTPCQWLLTISDSAQLGAHPASLQDRRRRNPHRAH